ncbi:MAG: phage tail protein I [Chloroflexi bacterium]|nr:phage tail protein I [Chloroflexota bacterium]
MAEFITRLTIEGPDGIQHFVIPPGVSTMGRQAGNEIHLNDPLVSRQHARLECSDKGCTITDLGSANGSSLNGEPLTAHAAYPLADGAIIQVGPFKLTYEQTQIVVVEAAASPKAETPVRAPVKETPVKADKGKTPPASPPPDEPPLSSMPPQPPPRPQEPDYSVPPPGLGLHSDRYLQYLPGIYQNDFMGRLLGMLEAIMAPIEWNVDNFDLFLDPKTAPPEFIPWLESWFSAPFDSTWSDDKKRDMLREASKIYARRGTRWAVSRVLEIYTGVAPEIHDLDEKLDDFTFTVALPLKEHQVKRDLVENLINTYKPSHTAYILSFTG